VCFQTITTEHISRTDRASAGTVDLGIVIYVLDKFNCVLYCIDCLSLCNLVEYRTLLSGRSSCGFKLMSPTVTALCSTSWRWWRRVFPSIISLASLPRLLRWTCQRHLL